MVKNQVMLKYDLLLEKMKDKKQVAVAFSGGVDSTLVAYAAKESGNNVILITLTSPLFSSYDENISKLVAKELDLKQIIMHHDLDEDVAKNEKLRCYYCKKDEAKIWVDLANKYSFSTVADGANYDDTKDIRRPGVKACNEIGIWHPLAEARIKKNDVRVIAKELGISIWNRPSNACLASRVKFGEKITIEKLKMIEKAEDYLRDISSVIRVRLHNNIARIEVPTEFLNEIIAKREEIVENLKKIGLIYITIDLEGFRTGSMNEEIKIKK